MQTLQKRSVRLSRSARIVLVFLCNVLIIVFDHTLSVQAADTVDVRLTIASAYIYRSNPYVTNAQLVASMPYNQTGLSSNSSIGTYNWYESKVPFNLYFPGYNGKSTLTAVIPIQFYVKSDNVLRNFNVHLNTDNEHVSALSLTDSDKRNQVITITNEWQLVKCQLRVIDLPVANGYSASFNLICGYEYHNLIGTSGVSDPGLVHVTTYWAVDGNAIHISASGLDSGSVGSNVSDIADQIEKDREEDRQDAEQGGEDATDLVKNLDSGIKSKWEILWYPIEFTTRVASVFGAGTASASYKHTYVNVVGYEYDEQSGYLVPILDRSRAQARAGGTVISFPAFSLLGMQIWDAYDFDLSQLKSWFPELFNLLYVVISILEVYWFVSFLRSKYDEVFG